MAPHDTLARYLSFPTTPDQEVIIADEKVVPADSSPTPDSSRVLGLLCAAIQTYNAYLGKAAFPSNPLHFITAPDGMRYEDFWWGQDIFDKKPIHEEVVFGLVFSSLSDAKELTFAFRGTEGISEWIDDARIGKVAFQPFAGGSLPDDVGVEHGFDEVYASMQASLFALIDRLAPTKIWITGHSLGSSLAALFTLDVALSRPNLPATLINFASPRTGNEGFATFYQAKTAARGIQTTRVVNTADLVPRLPPHALGYRHVGTALQICFESGDAWVIPNYGLRHVADNYYRALCRIDHEPGCDCRLEASDHGADLKLCTPNPAAKSLSI